MNFKFKERDMKAPTSEQWENWWIYMLLKKEKQFIFMRFVVDFQYVELWIKEFGVFSKMMEREFGNWDLLEKKE